MNSRRTALRRTARPLLIPMLLLPCLPALGEELTWSADVPFAAGDVIEIDLGALPQGVTSVVFQGTGTLGSQPYSCTVCCDPEGLSGTTPIYPDLLLDATGTGDEALAFAAAPWPNASGAWTFTAVPAAGQEDWAFLADGVFAVTKWGHHAGYPYPFPTCTGVPGSTEVTFDHLTVTVTCASTVAEEASTWGRVKAVYR